MAGQWEMEEAYEMLMSPLPSLQASAAAMIRNFGTAATLTAQKLRTTAAGGEGAGDAGAAMSRQSEVHAEWFDQVAANSAHAANRLEALATNGHTYQAEGLTTYTKIQQAIEADQAEHQGANDMHQVSLRQQGGQQLSGKVNAWSQDYAAFSTPAPPPVSTANSGTYGGGAPGGSAGSGSDVPVSGAAPQVHGGATKQGEAFIVPAGATSASSGSGRGTLDRGPGVPGSIEVGPDGGDFAGWYKDPRTGYYVDPQTGREYDPASQRWVDPVTGRPFGDVAKYATGLQGVGPESTTGGLLSSGAGGGGSFAGLVGAGVSGDPAAVAAGYSGALPPSLANGSAASGALWNQASRSLGVNRAVASELVGREQAARAGRPYAPSTQAQAGQGLGGARSRPGYVTADEEESALFSSPNRRRTTAAVAEEEELPVGAAGRSARGAVAAEEEGQAGAAGRRSYLPPAQSGGKADKDSKRRDRPDWLVDDAFGVEEQPAGSGVLGE